MLYNYHCRIDWDYLRFIFFHRWLPSKEAFNSKNYNKIIYNANGSNGYVACTCYIYVYLLVCQHECMCVSWYVHKHIYIYGYLISANKSHNMFT